MHTKHWPIGALIAPLIALITACNSTSQGADPTSTLYVIPTPAATEMVAAPTPTVIPTPLGDLLDTANLGTDTLDSYRSTFTMIWSGTDDSGAPIDGSYSVETDFNRDPHARRVWWSSSATAVPNAVFELFEVGDDAWTVMGDAADTLCLSGSRDELGSQDAPYTPDYWLTKDQPSALQRILPDEPVNGAIAQHYRMTPADQPTFAGYSDYTYDVWIATEGAHVVRQSLIADGPFTDFATGSGHLEWVYDILEANQPITVTPPTCE